MVNFEKYLSSKYILTTPFEMKMLSNIMFVSVEKHILMIQENIISLKTTHCSFVAIIFSIS